MANNNLQSQANELSKPIGEMNLIRLAEVSQLTTLRPSTIFKAIKNNTMPKPIKLLGRINAWDKDEILNWLESMRSNRQ